MDVNWFLRQLLEQLSRLPFVKNLDLKTEVIVVKGRVFLDQNFFLQVYFNERTETTAFALVKEEKRMWGIDFDSIRGWHLHPVENPDDHQVIEPKTIAEIIDHLEKAWDVLTSKES
ncbi:MAG TPA: hypothetical protein VK469_11700 [Candidatus Kapabacteria bacterium]|nr:hypothetical protein [Candidatus Kapabacteria bacterium]